jgi:predicted nucleic acid-binding protein
VTRTVLLDTGFLVALVNSADPAHLRCMETWSTLRARVLTVEGVLVEAAHLLRRLRGGPAAAVHLAREAAVLVPCEDARLARATALMHRYENIPMDLVDALLVALGEESDTREILTLDVRGFASYRLGRSTPFVILPEPR